MQQERSVHQGALLERHREVSLDGWLDEACTVHSDACLEKLKAVLLSATQGGDDSSFSKKQLLKALVKLAMNDTFLLEGWDVNGGSMLPNLIDFPDPEMQILGCLVLAKQANTLPEEVLKEAIPSLIQLLNFDSCSSQGISFREVSLLAVRRFAKRGAGLRMSLGRAGVVASLLTLVSCQHHEQLHVLALEALKELVLSTKNNQELLTQAGGVQVVLDLVCSCSVKIRCLAAEIIGLLASYRDVRREIASLSGVTSLIEAVRGGSMTSRARAAHALGLLAFTKRLRRLVVDAGGIPVLIDLLREGDEVAKLVAGNALGIISACVDHLSQVAQAGAIPLFIALLEGGNPYGKDIAEDAFCVLAVSEENALAIMEHLVKILSHGSVEAKAAAADIIWDLSSYRHSVSIVMASGAIPVLIGLLKDRNDELRENVSGAIAQLTYDDEHRYALAEMSVIPILVELLQDSSTEVKANASEALNNFAEDPVHRLEIMDACAVLGLGPIQDVAQSMPEHVVSMLNSMEDYM